MNISALSHYSRVIKTKRGGTCHTCGASCIEGRDFAAVNGSNKWFAYCTACAGSFAAQVAGMVKRVEAAADGIDPIVLADVPMPDEAVMVSVMNGTGTPAEAYDIVTKLFGLLAVIGASKVQADPLIDALRAIAADSAAQPRDREFAASLVSYHGSKGCLTDRQRFSAERMVSKLGTVTGPVAAVEVGMYLGTDGSIRRAYMTQNDRLGVRLLHVHDNGDGTSTGSMEYEKGGVRVLGSLLAKGEARLLTQDEAAAFGKLHSFCCVCSIDLEDDRSLVAGYGPVCAQNNGWWYPTAAEARAILDRPTGMA